nr:MAG: CwlK [Microvirus sp.]
MRNSSMEELCPTHRADFVRCAQLLARRGIHVFETYRSHKDQDEAYRRRTSKARGGQSPHQYGMAVDFVPRAGERGWFWPPASDPLWHQVRLAALSCGLSNNIEWDRPHVECACWASYQAARKRAA